MDNLLVTYHKGTFQQLGDPVSFGRIRDGTGIVFAAQETLEMEAFVARVPAYL